MPHTMLPPTSDTRPGGRTAGVSFRSMGLRARLREFRERHKRAETVLFFAGGFCFDLLLLERIDSVPMLIHQGSYVLLLSILILVDHHYTVGKREPHGFLG